MEGPTERRRAHALQKSVPKQTTNQPHKQPASHTNKQKSLPDWRNCHDLVDYIHLPRQTVTAIPLIVKVSSRVRHARSARW